MNAQAHLRASSAAIRGFDAERSASTGVPATPDLARLHIGDPCFNTPDHIVEAAVEAMRSGRYCRYAPSRGDPELREAVARRAGRMAGAPIDPAQVLVTAGGTAAIHAALAAMVDPGDEVLVFSPAYSLYGPIVRQMGGTLVHVPMGPGFRPDAATLENALTGRSKLLILNNPGNPTGMVITREELRAIAAVAARAGLMVLADEVYDELVFGEPFVSTLAIEELAGRLVYVNSFSKTYAMTGWRLGYVIAPPDFLNVIATVYSNAQGPVGWATQRAGIAALDGPVEPVVAMIEGYAARRRHMVERMPVTNAVTAVAPEGAFYLFVHVDMPGMTSRELTARLLEAGVSVRSGTEFGPEGEGYLRLSYASSFEDIDRGMARFRGVIDELAQQGVLGTP